MSEQIKECAENAANFINSIGRPEQAELAARLAETFAVGLATGMEISGTGKPARKSEAAAE